MVERSSCRLGVHSRPNWAVRAMSGLPPIATELQTSPAVRFVPIVLQTPKMPCGQFPANRPVEPQSPTDVASMPLPKSPMSSSLDNVIPQMIIRSPRVRPRKFVFSDAKRPLQQYPLNSGHSLLRRCHQRTAARGTRYAVAIVRRTARVPSQRSLARGRARKCGWSAPDCG